MEVRLSEPFTVWSALRWAFIVCRTRTLKVTVCALLSQYGHVSGSGIAAIGWPSSRPQHPPRMTYPMQPVSTVGGNTAEIDLRWPLYGGSAL